MKKLILTTLAFTALSIPAIGGAAKSTSISAVAPQITEFIINSTSVYESPRGAPFLLKMFHYASSGECEKICAKEKISFFVSTFDEDPEGKGFAVTLDGSFDSLGSVSIPSKETGGYKVEINVENDSGTKSCKQYSVSLRSATFVKGC